MLRLGYEIDAPHRLRQHLHLVDGAGYFFFPGVASAEGRPVTLEITFSATGKSAFMRGTVWARPASGGLWLELPRAARFLDMLDFGRADVRVATDGLVLAKGAGQPAMLCRLRDVSAGGARFAAAPEDLGGTGAPVRVPLPEAGPCGGQLQAYGRLVWAGEGEAGVEWNQGDLASRAAVRRMLQMAEEEWAGARAAAHSLICRCFKDHPTRKVMLLG